MKNPKIGTKVIVYDRFRFAIPLRGEIMNSSNTNDGVEVRLLESNNATYPIGTDIWVDKRQLRKDITPPPKPKKLVEKSVEGWVNVYRSNGKEWCGNTIFDTEEEAIRNKDSSLFGIGQHHIKHTWMEEE